MIKRLVITLLGFVLVVLTLGAVKVAQLNEMQAPPQPIMSVSSVDATSESWNPVISTIGDIAPVQGIELSAEGEGAVTKINFQNGQPVKAGDVLIELDTSVEVAQLKAAQAQLELARLEANRSQELLQKNTISQAQLDQAMAQLNQIQATVASLEAMIQKKIVRAPFAGRVGIRHVNIGQYVNRGQPLVPLQKLDELYVNFNLPERDLPKLQQGQVVRLTVDAFPGRTFEGKLNAIDPVVNSQTRNVSVQALLPNPDEVLRPGMFARVEVVLPEQQSLVVLPATAIYYNAYGNSVFVVEQMKGKDGKEYLGVRQQFVKLGDRRGDLIAVLDGVKPGEKVVSAGVFKLRNSMPVQINNSVQPSSSPNPTPANT
jgi:membrane fusion protein, multidrug efflux system